MTDKTAAEKRSEVMRLAASITPDEDFLPEWISASVGGILAARLFDVMKATPSTMWFRLERAAPQDVAVLRARLGPMVRRHWPGHKLRIVINNANPDMKDLMWVGREPETSPAIRVGATQGEQK
jgi:hypothetical protein